MTGGREEINGSVRGGRCDPGGGAGQVAPPREAAPAPDPRGEPRSPARPASRPSPPPPPSTNKSTAAPPAARALPDSCAAATGKRRGGEGGAGFARGLLGRARARASREWTARKRVVDAHAGLREAEASDYERSPPRKMTRVETSYCRGRRRNLKAYLEARVD